MNYVLRRQWILRPDIIIRPDVLYLVTHTPTP